MCEYCKNDGYYKVNKSLISKTLKNNQDTREYTPRVIKDLKCAKKKR